MNLDARHGSFDRCRLLVEQTNGVGDVTADSYDHADRVVRID